MHSAIPAGAQVKSISSVLHLDWAALLLLVISMFFTHVVILLKICYVISDKQKYISLVVVNRISSVVFEL